MYAYLTFVFRSVGVFFLYAPVFGRRLVQRIANLLACHAVILQVCVCLSVHQHMQQRRVKVEIDNPNVDIFCVCALPVKVKFIPTLGWTLHRRKTTRLAEFLGKLPRSQQTMGYSLLPPCTMRVL